MTISRGTNTENVVIHTITFHSVIKKDDITMFEEKMDSIGNNHIKGIKSISERQISCFLSW